MKSLRHVVRDTYILAQHHSGMARVRRRRLQRERGGLARIVVHHKVRDLALFERQVEMYAREHEVVPLSRIVEGELDPDRPSLAITFDDGYASWLRAASILRARGLAATFFVSSGFIDAGEDGSWAAFCRDRLGVQPAEPLRWADVRALRAAGFDIGGHTRRHPSLASVRDPDDLAREVREDKGRLESMLGSEVPHFAYPYGDPSSFSSRTRDAVAAAGYRCAATLLPGFCSSRSDPFALPRDSIGELRSLPVMRAWLAGGYDDLRARMDGRRA